MENTEIKTKTQLIKESKKGPIDSRNIKSKSLWKYLSLMIETGNASRDYNMITIHW